MDRQIELFTDAAERYIAVAENVAKYVDDASETEESSSGAQGDQPDKKKRRVGGSRRANLDRIRKMMTRTLRKEAEFRRRFRAMELTREQLEKTPDLELHLEYDRFLSEQPKETSDEELKKHPAYLRLEEVIEANTKEASSLKMRKKSSKN